MLATFAPAAERISGISQNVVVTMETEADQIAVVEISPLGDSAVLIRVAKNFDDASAPDVYRHLLRFENLPLFITSITTRGFRV